MHDVGVVQVVHPAQRLAGGGMRERFITLQGRVEQGEEMGGKGRPVGDKNTWRALMTARQWWLQ